MSWYIRMSASHYSTSQIACLAYPSPTVIISVSALLRLVKQEPLTSLQRINVLCNYTLVRKVSITYSTHLCAVKQHLRYHTCQLRPPQCRSPAEPCAPLSSCNKQIRVSRRSSQHRYLEKREKKRQDLRAALLVRFLIILVRFMHVMSVQLV